LISFILGQRKNSDLAFYLLKDDYYVCYDKKMALPYSFLKPDFQIFPWKSNSLTVNPFWALKLPIEV